MPISSSVYVCPPGNVCFKQDTFVIGALLFVLSGFVYAYVMSIRHQEERRITIINKRPLPHSSRTPEQESDQASQRSMSEERLFNPVEEPRRTYPFTTDIYNNVQRQQRQIPINVSTRGDTRDFQPIGTLTNVNHNHSHGHGPPNNNNNHQNNNNHSNNNNNNHQNNNNENNNNSKILQLFGRAIYPGSYKWQYYTNSDNFQSVKVQLMHKGRQCLDDIGCEELSTGDIVRVPAYNMHFRVELYNLDKPMYIPL